MKKLIYGVCISLFSGMANAAMLNFNAVSGELQGADQVLISGNYFDVDFVDGSCVSIFDGCDNDSDFFFSDSLEARHASQALLDQVLVASWDSTPSLVDGCDDGFLLCSILTPYTLGISTTSFVQVDIAHNEELYDGRSMGLMPRNSDFSSHGRYVWAVWSESLPVSSVPLPATLPLLALGLLMLGWHRSYRVLRRTRGSAFNLLFK